MMGDFNSSDVSSILSKEELLKRADKAYDYKNYGEALQLYERYCNMERNCRREWLRQGKIHAMIAREKRELDYYNIAKTAFDTAIRLDPRDNETISELTSLTEYYANALANVPAHLKIATKLMKNLLFYSQNNAQIYYGIAQIYLKRNKLIESVYYLRRCVELDSEFVAALLSLAKVYNTMSQSMNCAEILSHALKQHPNDPNLLNLEAIIYYQDGFHKRAHDSWMKALRHTSHAETIAAIAGNVAKMKFEDGEYEEAISLYTKYNVQNGPLNLTIQQCYIFFLNILVGSKIGDLEITPEYVQSEHFKISKFLPHKPRIHDEKLHISHDLLKRRLKTKSQINIGYIGGNFSLHSVAHFILPVIQNHDRETFKVYIYANQLFSDEITAKFKEGCEYRDVYFLSREECADLIEKDKIDILIDLAGHTAGNKIDVLSIRPTPIQMLWIGYPNTSGITAIDYYVTDAVIDPPDTSQQFTEKLLRLKRCFHTYMPFVEPQIIQEERDHVVFGCFNKFHKISDEVIRCWNRILSSEGLENAELLVKGDAIYKDGESEDEREAKFKKKFDSNVRDRVKTLPFVPSKAEHLSLYNKVDVSLDTFPYSGTTTTCESLLMGVSVVTLFKKGIHAHNVSSSFLKELGLETIAEDYDEYVEIARKLARKRPKKIDLRRKLKESYILDHSAFTKDFESSLIDLIETLPDT
jgi:protein O-GlcNAc transferase